MGEEEDGRPPGPPGPSTSTQGYHGTGLPYGPPYMMPTYPNPYPYTWGSQHFAMPPFGPTMPYPMSRNLDELREGEDTTQREMPHDEPTMRNPNFPSGSSSMQFSVESEENVTRETSPVINLESPNAEEMFEDSDEDNKVEPPKAGMKFGSDKEVLVYYKRYAKQEGFGVIIRRTKRDIDGSPKYVTISCARGGKYYPSVDRNLSKPRPTTKTDCKAKVNARLVNGEWVLTSVDLVHNHSTVSPKKSRFFLAQ
ncbi:protein FAR1-RELATED SEQUENCE 5-like [Carya illinoinensis]|uniref:protein FAR1-RELATED SEQUENCE 5-like n=1 Tax=Carya illinoinensis TaxID=32201 RepID=UPI001C71DB76|nr:protein FAR1-RELATED SEQUENCE 5-like [Carya illinoinensis]